MLRAVIILLASSTYSGAIELPVKQQAPGLYEVCVQAESADDRDGAYAIAFRRKGTDEIVGTSEAMGGYTNPRIAANSALVLWHGSGEIVAFTDRRIKHPKALYIYSVSDYGVTRLNFLDYVQNALGRVDAVSVGLHCISTPLAWWDDDLTVEFHVSVDRAESERRFYKSSIVLRLERHPSSSPRIRLVSVTKPIDLDKIGEDGADQPATAVESKSEFLID
jgi:hypothetical protein